MEEAAPEALGWAGGPGRGQGAGSWQQPGGCRGQRSHEKGAGGHCSLRPTHRTVQWDEGLGELSSPPLAAVLSGGKMHTVPAREGGSELAAQLKQQELDAG